MLTGYTFKSYGADNTCSSGGGSYVAGVPIDNVYSGNNKWTGTNEFKHKTIINDLSVNGVSTFNGINGTGFFNKFGKKNIITNPNAANAISDPRWIGLMVDSNEFYNDTSRNKIVMGNYLGKALIGAHQVTINEKEEFRIDWADLYLNRDQSDSGAGASVYVKNIIVASLATFNGSTTLNDSSGWYFDKNNLITVGTDKSALRQYTSTTNENLSIKAEQGVAASSFFAWSDSRIKNNILDIDDGNALTKLRNLQPKTYAYIDKINRGYETVIGFIAQEVKEVIPKAVSIQTSFIPNFMTKCKFTKDTDSNSILYIVDTTIDLSWNPLHDYVSGKPYIDMSGNACSDASGNKHFKIKLYDPSNHEFELNTLNIIDKTHFSIDLTGSKLIDESGIFIGNKGSYQGINGETIEYENEYFLYGQEVDDFHSLDKQAIFTVATAALQEVDRQQQADKIRITNLETQVEQLLHKIENLETENKKMRDRFEVIEDRLRKI